MVHRARKNKVLFRGGYNETQLNKIQISEGNGVATGLTTVSRNPSGLNYLNVNSQTVYTSPTEGTELFNEVYTIASYDGCRNKIGQITWVGLYPNTGSGEITRTSTQIFDVSASSGIFYHVIRVSITFNDNDPQKSRSILFLGERKRRHKNHSGSESKN